MTLETIYIARHGFRSGWTVDPVTGTYTAHIRSPTGIAADPALTSHGVDQARELAAHLIKVQPAIERVYSSPYYRCLQTIDPFVQLRRSQHLSDDGPENAIRAEPGLSEWFGSAPFDHPRPAPIATLKRMFPSLDDTYEPLVMPEQKGESLLELYERTSKALRAVIAHCDAEGVKSIVICSHAAAIIAMGRVLTGMIPTNPEDDDFHAFTCGLSIYRRSPGDASTADNTQASGSAAIGGWTCEANSDCSFLTHGEERGWRFAGDEAFPGTGSLTQADDAKL
ncbi:histidine phosphatase superfamily (branch 1) domain-containing protein [Sarocladium implicatum]|nr:histidine phosphatase superfamily (branch 1) domain-containing protein [Sarocladium implicatum]